MSSVRRSQFGPLGWPEQWLRVRRWHQRVAPILADPPPPRSPGEADAADDVFAFFMNCYHLKDWLKNDLADPHPEAEKFVDDTEVLPDLPGPLQRPQARGSRAPSDDDLSDDDDLGERPA